MYQKITNFLSAPNTKYWAKTLSKFLSFQLVIQIVTALAGILIIRTLSKQEYAYFTIANSLQSTMNLLSNSGISIGLLAIGGRIWQDSYEMGRLTNTVLKLRFLLALLIVPIITVMLIWLLINAGASIPYTLFIVTAILVELFFYFYLAIFQVHLQLHSLFNKIQQQNFIVGFTRFSLIFASYLTILNASIATWISTVASGLNFWLLKKSTIKFFQPQAPVSQEYKKELIQIFKYRFPNAFFNVIQGQITIWIITIFGSAENIAEVGALSRLAILFSLFFAVIQNIVAPSFAKCQSISLLRKRYIILLIFSFLVVSPLLFFSYLYPQLLLWILGANYNHLIKELFWMMFSSIIGIMNRISFTVNASKGWIKDSWKQIPLTLIIQISIIFFLNLSEVKGVIFFGICSQIPALVVNLYMNYLGLSGHRDYHLKTKV